jgi:Amt family ammonium transporter
MDGGSIAWVLTSCALVLFMTPGLALFYGGMVRSKNVLNMLMKNFITIGIVSVVWAIVGFSIAFGTDAGGLLGGLDYLGLGGVEGDFLLFMIFQMMFAIITPALISGAVAERMKFTAWVVFTAAWALIVYPIVAHWAFAPDGWLYAWGVRDFAGGLVVHINAGIAALALVFALGPRKGFGAEAMKPHSVPLTLLGTGILWFGWFGFNAGSAFAADGLAVNAFVTTQLAAAVATLAWVATEWSRGGRPTSLGAASGAVAGLVAITPAAGYVSPMSAMAIGAAAGIICSLAVSLKYRFGFDDSLDVVAVHLVGGIVGSLAVGVFASSAINSTVADGLVAGGGFELLLKQVVAVLAVIVFTFVVSYVLARIIKAVTGLRVDDEAELRGLDISLHDERGYSLVD